MDPDYPAIQEDRFTEHDWTDFCKHATDPMPPKMPEPRGRAMTVHCFVDSDHAGDKVTRRSQTGMPILCNRPPGSAGSQRQNDGQDSATGGERGSRR